LTGVKAFIIGWTNAIGSASGVGRFNECQAAFSATVWCTVWPLTFKDYIYETATTRLVQVKLRITQNKLLPGLALLGST
jgi:hypothetical protein